MRITSQAFTDQGKIPNKYTMYGENRIPPIHLEDVPERARSLALVVHDPDASRGDFCHWLLINMDPKTREIKEDCVPVMATQGRNDFGEIEYDGPRPPSGQHRYFFNVFALDTVLPLSRGSSRDAIEREMRGHVLDEATLMGNYEH